MMVHRFKPSWAILAGAVLANFAVVSAYAQVPTPLPEISVAPPPLLKDTHRNDESGASKGTGQGPSFDRLNRDLKRKVDEVNPSVIDPPLDARSPDTKVGIVNIPGVQQQYGKNFGHSVYPYRPSSPVFSAPSGPRR
jgi:hypothetical protein